MSIHSDQALKQIEDPLTFDDTEELPNKSELHPTEVDQVSESHAISVDSKVMSVQLTVSEDENKTNTEDNRHVRRIIAEDPLYNLANVSELELKSISKIIDNFTFNSNMYIQLKPSHKRQVLEQLSLDIPLKVVSHLIEDGVYWKRKCEHRWPLSEVSHYGNSWKRMFHEKNLEQIIENFVPERTDLTCLEDTVELSIPFVQRMVIAQLLPPIKVVVQIIIADDSSDADSNSFIDEKPKIDHIFFNPIIAKLTNLTELKIIFDVINCGMNFEWDTFQFTINDCLQLAKCVAATSQLKVFHLIRSRIDCDRCRVLIKNILGHPNLMEIDFSHNHIGDRGAIAIGKFIHNSSELDCLRITNNMITTIGAQAIAFSLLRNVSLRVLDMRLNRILDDGGYAICKALLSNESLEEINLSGNDMGDKTAEILSDVLNRKYNLISVDVSNNRLGLEGGKRIQHSLIDNRKLLKLDMRFTECGDDVMFAVSQIIAFNQKLKMYENEIDTEIQRHSTHIMSELHKTIFGPVEAEPEVSPTQSSIRSSLHSNKIVLFDADDEESSSAFKM